MIPALTVRDIRLAERTVTFQRPFRFGSTTVTSAPQVFVHAEIKIDGRTSFGATAELMVPKWFDKNPAISIEETVEELRQSLVFARELYLKQRAPLSAFALHAAVYPHQLKTCARVGMPQLAALFGPAEIDKAIVDALLRVLNLNVFSGFARNIVGLDTRLTPDLDQAAIDRFLSSRRPRASIHVRHTVGMMDAPESARQVALRDGCRYFKIKLCGDPQSDVKRLHDIADVLDNLSIDYRVTLDANEQYANLANLLALVDCMTSTSSLAQISKRTLYIEQPLPRERTWQTPLGVATNRFAFIVDEADDDYDVFPRATELGYAGISSKSCKGMYKSLLNGTRAALAGEKLFMTAEDLTCQAGLAVQQDSALAAVLGCTHVERNGHHYVDGFSGTPQEESDAFLAAHGDLYRRDQGAVRLKIETGELALGSLATIGFASAVSPEKIGRTSTTEIRTKGHVA